MSAAQPALHFKPEPIVLTIAELGPEFDGASVTDIEAADFDRDGRTDLAVAWYATDTEDNTANLRVLTFFYGTGGTIFERGPDLSLYVRNTVIESLSVFRNGTSELAVGDFDGDGDADIAATPYFGDEIWFIENTGPRQYMQRVKYMFGLNSPANSVTPTEATTADFDGDGRDDVVYVADPIQRIVGLALHFWRSGGAMASISRVSWEGISDDYTSWTRGLAVADFDGDSRPDLCFSASSNATQEVAPVLVFWHNLDVSSARFEVASLLPGFICSDVVDLRGDAWCGQGVALTDRDGVRMEFWSPTCDGLMGYAPAASVAGFPGCSIDRGMSVVRADLNGDGMPDLVTRQKIGEESCPRVDFVLGTQAEIWTRVDPSAIESAGFLDPLDNEILRPRNLAAADLFGNRLPEVIAGFGPTPRGGTPGLGALEVVFWANGCLADLNDDGTADIEDLATLLASFGCDGGPDQVADLDRDGCVTLSDLALLLADFGCTCCGE
jgi:hypothetical protein